VGVVLVLGYHFYGQWLPGGFIGVDVFFVFSGFLISALLQNEFVERGRISLAAFYRRRVRRLLPAVLTMLLLCVPLSLLLPADFRAQLGQQVAAVLGWVTNFYEIASGGSYDAQLLPHLFIHTWTLAVELQYYLVWALVLYACFHFLAGGASSVARRSLAKRRPSQAHSGLERARKLASSLALLLALASFVCMQVFYSQSPDLSLVYMSSASHLFPLMLGSWVGLNAGYSHTGLVRRLEKLPSLAGIALTVLALAGIVAMALLMPFESAFTYHVGILATSLLCSVVLLVGRGAQARLQRIPELKPIKWLASRSYGIYLFHWPFYIICAYGVQAWCIGHGFDAGLPFQVAIMVALLLTLLIADLCFRLVEQPFRAGARDAYKVHLRQLCQASRGMPGAVLATRRRERALAAGALVCVLALLWTLAQAPLVTSIAANFDSASLTASALNLSQVADQGAAGGVAPPKSGAAAKQASLTVYTIGDSVPLDAAPGLIKLTKGRVDCKIGRAMYVALQMVKAKVKAGNLADILVIATTTNPHPNTLAYATDICKLLPKGHRLVFVNGYAYNTSASAQITRLAEGLSGLSSKYPYVTIADWRGAISGERQLLAPDRTHFGDLKACSKLYCKVVKAALARAQAGPAR
jgi:peptidoglycan/LPS O-acetylase OafA/YrhL